MVQIYAEPLALRHHARVFTSAVIVRVLSILGTIVLSYTLAYTSEGFWTKTRDAYEQPTVSFAYGMVVILEGSTLGQQRLWSSFPVARELYGDRLLSMIATTQEFDDNFDGKPDVITISATARGANIEVHSAKILLDFDYKIKDAVDMHMVPTVYVAYASPVPGAALFTTGELSLQQRDPLPFRSRRRAYNESLLEPPLLRNLSIINESDETVQSIVIASSSRNESAVYKDMQPVWLAGDGNEFKLEMRFKIPSNQRILIRPRTVEMLKLAWIQYLAVFAILWYILSWAEYVVFHYRILRTRLVSDLQHPKQRF